MLERDLERRLMIEVRRLGGAVYKIDSRARKGAPDRVVALPFDTPFFLELKTEQGRVSPLQAREHERLLAIGQRVEVTYGWQEVLRALSA